MGPFRRVQRGGRGWVRCVHLLEYFAEAHVAREGAARGDPAVASPCVVDDATGARPSSSRELVLRCRPTTIQCRAVREAPCGGVVARARSPRGSLPPRLLRIVFLLHHDHQKVVPVVFVHARLPFHGGLLPEFLWSRTEILVNLPVYGTVRILLRRLQRGAKGCLGGRVQRSLEVGRARSRYGVPSSAGGGPSRVTQPRGA
mmetsp:Transcript_31786/g.68643  ORF Transcript_31786/g.68643 Transcript_31786/m.68643 type:complete len:201 (-) Transcript_31786:763-1365(-)